MHHDSKLLASHELKNWLFEDYFEPKRPQRVYDREDEKVVLWDILVNHIQATSLGHLPKIQRILNK